MTTRKKTPGSSKEAFKANVTARLEALEVSAYAASINNGKRDAWLSDVLGRSPRGVYLDVKDAVADALGVGRNDIDRPGADMLAPAHPPWAEKARESVHAAKMRAVDARVKANRERAEARKEG